MVFLCRLWKLVVLLYPLGIGFGENCLRLHKISTLPLNLPQGEMRNIGSESINLGFKILFKWHIIELREKYVFVAVE